MPEVNSTQMAAVAARSKLLPSVKAGRYRTLYARYVQGAATQAIADTIYLGDLPRGARISREGIMSLSTGTAACTLSIGLRTKSTGAVLAVAGIASAVDAATAGQKAINNGTLIANGAEYVTVAVVEVFATINTAVLAASQQIAVEVNYVQD